MRSTAWTLEELAAWAGHAGFPAMWERVALSPHPDMWPRSTPLASCLDRIMEVVPEQKYPILQALCLAGLCLNRDCPPASLSILQNWISPGEVGLPMSWSELLECTWMRIPLLVADERTETASSVWILAGRGKTSRKLTLPAWATTRLDQEALAGVRIAADLEAGALDQGFVFWPMIDFTRPGLRIRGRSLALPAVLAFNSLARGCPSPGLAATGCIDESGRLRPVSHLQAKARAAANTGMTGLLYPSPADTVPHPSPADLELLPIPDIRTAKDIQRMYTPGYGGALVQALQPNQAPHHLFSCLLCLPGEVLSRIEARFTPVRTTVHELCTTQDILGLQQVLDLLAPAEDGAGLNQALIHAILDAVPPSVLDDLYPESPELCLRFCRLHLMRCRHQGRIHDWTAWRQWIESKQLTAATACLDQGETKLLMFMAEQVVQDRHNRFSFVPDLQRVLGPWFLNEMEIEKTRFNHRLQTNGTAVHKALGCLYGTLAQHFGFCGPDHLQTCRAYVHKAQTAFGQGRNADTRPDWLREFSYLVYAYLDARKWDEAEAALLAYLECPAVDQFDPRHSNPFHHAASIRFLADTGREVPTGYWDWWAPRLGTIPNAHPWQLWALNMGRLAPDPARKKVFWETACRVCDAIPGETTKAMLLLPLAHLTQNDMAPSSWLQETTHMAMQAIQSALDPEHFAPLTASQNWRDVLIQVHTRPERFFPFSYR